MHKSQRLINHVALVLDASSSMTHHTDKLVEVADEQIRHLALRSEELSQETRVSVYTFNEHVKCLIFDMDVMRLPSIADLYRANGMTALVDATIKSQNDLSTTSQIYGDHAFLSFILTDGLENASKSSWRMLPQYTSGKPNWSVGFLVPDKNGEAYLRKTGVHQDSIAIWDATSAEGMQDSFSTIRTATDTFMTNRASGIVNRGIFSTGTDAVNKATVSQLSVRNGFKQYNVGMESRIDEFVSAMTGRYNAGSTYYQLVKRETIQPQKAVLIRHKVTGEIFGGSEARSLIGLPNHDVRVSPNTNPDYEIYIQSTSQNRKLPKNTSVLVSV